MDGKLIILIAIGVVIVLAVVAEAQMREAVKKKTKEKMDEILGKGEKEAD